MSWILPKPIILSSTNSYCSFMKKTANVVRYIWPNLTYGGSVARSNRFIGDNVDQHTSPAQIGKDLTFQKRIFRRNLLAYLRMKLWEMKVPFSLGPKDTKWKLRYLSLDKPLIAFLKALWLNWWSEGQLWSTISLPRQSFCGALSWNKDAFMIFTNNQMSGKHEISWEL